MSVIVAVQCVAATTWYVTISGNDSNTGKSQSVAFRTIQKAVDNASNGDTVLVGDGTYVPISTSKYGVINSDKRITIKSINGYASTIIDAKDQMCCFYDGGNYNKTNCCLIGFTLTNGHSPGNFNMGGAAIGGTVVNCLVSNCFARANAGAGHFTRFVNCLLTKNWTTEGYASVAYSSELINCTIVGNYVSGSLAGGQCAVYNCTLRNCILWKNLSSGNSVVTTYGICTTSNCCTSDPRFKDEAIGDYRLTSDSPCVNTGDDSFVRWDTDLAGNIRNNGVVDIGAFEYYPVLYTISNVHAAQRYPWNGFVDVRFSLTEPNGNKGMVSLVAKDLVGGTNIVMKTIRKADGSLASAKEQLAPGTYHWVWNAAADLPNDFKCERVTVEVTAE
jgi:hypothetical protein